MENEDEIIVDDFFIALHNLIEKKPKQEEKKDEQKAT
jgi:hypothetical protein